MIRLTKLNGEQFALNCDLIETVEEKPDTTIRLTTSRYLIVRESMDQVIELVRDFHRSTHEPRDITAGRA